MIQREKSLDLWIKKYGKEATWQRMVRALEKTPNQQGLAHYLWKKYSNPPAPSGRTTQKTFRYLATDEVREEVERITRNFAKLVTEIKKGAEKKKKILTDYMEERLRTGGKLHETKNIDDLFRKIQKCYCFLYYSILKTMVEIIGD